MRKKTLIEALFPGVRHGMLATLLMAPEKSWYLSDLARSLGTAPSSLQREAASLVDAGILLKRRDGNRSYFQADQSSPVFKELQSLFIKTSGLVDKVCEALDPLTADIQIAMIYGSVASGSVRSTSDVDVLVVGAVGLSTLIQALRPLEASLSRAVNPSLYSEDEFRSKVNAGNHFLTSVLREPKIFIIGSENDVAAIAGRGEGTSASDEQAGA